MLPIPDCQLPGHASVSSKQVRRWRRDIPSLALLPKTVAMEQKEKPDPAAAPFLIVFLSHWEDDHPLLTFSDISSRCHKWEIPHDLFPALVSFEKTLEGKEVWLEDETHAQMLLV